MARRRSNTLTEVELEFMRVVWAQGEVGTDDVDHALREKGRDLADGSIRKILSILRKKGYVTRRRKGRGFLYRARVAEGQAGRGMVSDLLGRMFGGSASLLVASLLDSKSITRDELAEIKQLIAKRESGSSKRQ